MKHRYDLAIIGSGFGGSLLAMIGCRLGLSVLLLEKGRHPRFAIGESTSPLANLLLEQLALRYDLPRLLPLASYGSWQRTYPQIGCGLKRGFSFYAHTPGTAYCSQPDRSNQLLVAASPHNEVADTHWLRADVDKFLVQEAIGAGAEYLDEMILDAPIRRDDGSHPLTGTRHGQSFSTSARLVVDATGPRGFLSRAWEMPETAFANYPPTQSLYTHFTGVRRCDTLDEFGDSETPPYPRDNAALHHVFPGGWMWILRFGNGLTSAGVALTEGMAQEIGLAEGEPAWSRFLARFPSIARQFSEAAAVRPFVYAPRLAYRASVAAGPGWAMLPSAAAFIDPLFSSGIPLTLLGIERLGRILEEAWETDTLDGRLQDYSRVTLEEADATADFLGACYAAMPHFPVFSALSMFYFAAASYSEMARRLEKPHLARRFLAADHPEFGAALRECPLRVREDRDFPVWVRDSVACLNVAGLCDPAKRNWYGVDLQDVVTNAAKLGKTPSEMRALLRSAPWAQPNTLLDGPLTPNSGGTRAVQSFRAF